MDPYKALNRVIDRKSFIQFLKALELDWEREQKIIARKGQKPYSAGPLGWQNGTIGTFLEAAGAWTETRTTDEDYGSDNPWRQAAEIIFAGKYYE